MRAAADEIEVVRDDRLCRLVLGKSLALGGRDIGEISVSRPAGLVGHGPDPCFLVCVGCGEIGAVVVGNGCGAKYLVFELAGPGCPVQGGVDSNVSRAKDSGFALRVGVSGTVRVGSADKVSIAGSGGNGGVRVGGGCAHVLVEGAVSVNFVVGGSAGRSPGESDLGDIRGRAGGGR